VPIVGMEVKGDVVKEVKGDVVKIANLTVETI